LLEFLGEEFRIGESDGLVFFAGAGVEEAEGPAGLEAGLELGGGDEHAAVPLVAVPEGSDGLLDRDLVAGADLGEGPGSRARIWSMRSAGARSGTGDGLMALR
jgi:hypothetical protein